MLVEKVFSFHAHAGAIYTLCAGPQPHLIFSAGSDKIIALWNLETGQQEPFAARMPAIVYSLCWLPEKKMLLVGTSAGAIHVIDFANKTELKMLQHHSAAIFDIQYANSNDTFFASSLDGSVSQMSASTFSVVRKVHLCDEKVRRMFLCEDQQRLLISCGDGSVRIFDTTLFKEIKKIAAHSTSCNVVIEDVRNGQLITGGKDAHLNCWSAKDDFVLQKSIPAHNFALYKLALSIDKLYIASASRDKTIKIWQAKNMELIVRIDKEKYEGHTQSVNDLLWLPYKNYLISAGDDRSIIVWKITY